MARLHVDSRRVTITTHRSGISFAASISFYANRWILLDRNVSVSKRLKYFNAVVSSFACLGQSTTLSWLLWMFIFENYADQSLDRRRRLIGMRLGTKFFIYGMNGSEVLLQVPAQIHGLTSHAKTIGIWQGMLPLCLRIGGFNVCCPGIL